MIKSEIPTRVRRALGSGVLAVASALIGYAAWAAEPALTAAEPAPLSEPDPAVGGKVQFTLLRAPGEAGPLQPTRKGKAKLSGNVPLQLSATTVTPGPNGQQTLEGDVRIVIPRPPGGHGKAKLILKTPAGDVVTENPTPQTLTLKAEKVVLTPLEGGDVQLEWENGTLLESENGTLEPVGFTVAK